MEFDGELEVQRWILTDVGSLRTLLLCEKIGLIILHLKEWSIYMGYARCFIFYDVLHGKSKPDLSWFAKSFCQPCHLHPVASLLSDLKEEKMTDCSSCCRHRSSRSIS